MSFPMLMTKLARSAAISAGTAFVLAVLNSSSYGAAINYGNFSGTGVDFLQITENSATDPTPLYGAPHVAAGDQLDFDPSQFASVAANGTADITDGLLQGVVQAKPGFGISIFALGEIGSYTLVGAGTPASAVAVGQIGFVKVTEVDGVALGGASFTVPFVGTFAPSNGDFFLPTEAGIAQPWFGVGAADIAGALAAKKISDPSVYGNFSVVTRVEFSSDNVLVSTSQPGTIAFIDKKDLVLDIDTVVPEPASICLFGLAIPALFARRR